MMRRIAAEVAGTSTLAAFACVLLAAPSFRPILAMVAIVGAVALSFLETKETR